MKNVKQNDFFYGMVTHNNVQYILTKEGGGGIGLHFSPFDWAFHLELKFSTIIDEPATFQVQGTRRAGYDLHKVFQQL